jgi:rubrerythrin
MAVNLGSVTIKNLEAAFAGETHEYSETYPAKAEDGAASAEMQVQATGMPSWL